jgi:antitoxin component YwqK of YwqJK toxin-antitoxin module
MFLTKNRKRVSKINERFFEVDGQVIYAFRSVIRKDLSPTKRKVYHFKNSKLLAEGSSKKVNFAGDEAISGMWVPDGHSVYCHPNGKWQYVGSYKNGEKDGLWSQYDLSGKIVDETYYRKGVAQTYTKSRIVSYPGDDFNIF